MTFLQGLNEYWSIIVFVAGIITHALWSYFKVVEHEVKIKALEVEAVAGKTSYSDLKSQISNIDSKLDILLTGYHKNNK